MYFLPAKGYRKILMVFSRVDTSWYDKLLKGYNHVCMVEVLEDDLVVIIEPTNYGARFMLRSFPTEGEWAKFKVVELDVVVNRSRKLIGPRFQSCATICQYMAGIDTGAILAQTLYKRLTCGWLEGITGVKEWE
jgi:hypothetical protein